MTRKEEILNGIYVDRGAYKVPDGYFDKLNERIMSNIAVEKQKRNIFLMPRFKYAVAACLTGLLLSTGIIAYFNQAKVNEEIASTLNSHDENVDIDEYAVDCMDYAMLNSNDVYSYISE